MAEIVLKKGGRKEGTSAVNYGSISAKAMEGKMEDVPWKMEAACTQKDTSSAPPLPNLLSLFQCPVLPG